MRLNIDVYMDYQTAPGDPVLLAVTAAQTEGQTVLQSDIEVEGATLRWIDGAGPRGHMVWAFVPGERLQLRYKALVDVTRATVPLDRLAPTRFPDLPGAVIPYLRPSRFCPSDLFVSFVAKKFGHLDGGAKVAAMRDWVAGALTYVPGSSTGTTTAIDTFVTREGVCRDYAHVMCSLARAANIPARYVSGYGPQVNPPDFHALAEVWLDGAWHLVDPTGTSTPSDLAVIGSGRDAADVSFMETENFAQAIYQRIEVSQV